jgi:AAA+ superfamily predicted ATPase
MQTEEMILTPAQKQALDGVLRGISVGDVVVLRGALGSGKTTILERVCAGSGGVLLGMREYMQALEMSRPEAIEESFLSLLIQAIRRADLVLVDDLHLVKEVVEGCDYPRPNLFEVALTALLAESRANGKKLVFSAQDSVPVPVWSREYGWKIKKFNAEDYECLCRRYLPAGIAARLDYTKVHRFAPNLNGHQLRKACLWLASEKNLGADEFVAYLRSQNLASNVVIEEVQPVNWKDLKGVDDVIRALEAKVALPFENDKLSSELGLKPKRGVLLAGPPGTGKTTIGRALAHRLKSKFFLIDGTAIAGSNNFYGTVERIFESAKRNAPSVVFIDDADVIFEDNEERGLYRYLLTMLDGLESASAEKVCVMLTAMDAGSLPPAMLRSGRIELWLETKLPDEEARSAILAEKIGKLPPPIGSADVAAIARASRGLTGAHLKAIVEDAKLLYAHDVVTGQPARPADEYFLEAIETVLANGRNYGRRKPARLAGSLKIGYAVDDLTPAAGPPALSAPRRSDR